MDLKTIAIVAEAFIAGIGLLSAIWSAVSSKISGREAKSLKAVLLAVPRAILMAEKIFLDGNGEQKKTYALTWLKELCSDLDIDFNKYQATIESAIEDCLATP